MAHKGIHTRGFLPHWDFENSVQAITFRLADSLPMKVVESWRKELQVNAQALTTEISRQIQAELHKRISQYEDAGHGECILSLPAAAAIVQNLFIAGHHKSYKLIDWCIMPNHVHLLVRLIDQTPLGSLIQKWKGSSSHQINILLKRTGPLWMRDYHDRYIRDIEHLHNAIAYIRNNPVKAGLCKMPAEWTYSAAGQNWISDFSPNSNTPDSD